MGSFKLTISFQQSLFSLAFLLLLTTNSFAEDHKKSENNTTTSIDAKFSTIKSQPGDSNTWFNHEKLRFVQKKIVGDFILYARTNKNINKDNKIGWTVRTSLEDNSPQINAIVKNNGIPFLQYKEKETLEGSFKEIRSEIINVDVIQLERKDNTYTMRVAKFGEPFVTEEVTILNLGEEVYVGLFMNENNKSEKEFYNDVRITIPAGENFVQYREYLGSNIELLEIATGKREIIYTSPKSLQAPNWTINGKSLIYNSEGLMYNFDLAKLKPTVINTGDIKSNNNDHVPSFDGKMLGLSSSVRELGGSIVWTVPITGGNPKQITPQGPSYLHGWSPDGKYLLFTGSRNKEFDIYRIPSDGGPEVRLTTAEGLDDGSEYTPDGKYIYFNSNRTGTMQIWRMKADGTQQEAVTNGEFHDWFPHVSPDGKWVVFLSFLKEEVESGDHPFYKHVYLRIIPITGGTPKVIAYVYGGQGTINTPSWSPDSKKIAFISNSKLD